MDTNVTAAVINGGGLLLSRAPNGSGVESGLLALIGRAGLRVQPLLYQATVVVPTIEDPRRHFLRLCDVDRHIGARLWSPGWSRTP